MVAGKGMMASAIIASSVTTTGGDKRVRVRVVLVETRAGTRVWLRARA